MQERIKIVLKSGKEQSLRRFHPWVFSGAIKKMYGNPSEGDLVDVYDNKDTYLAVGHWAPSSIAVRVLSFEQVTPDISFFREKIKRAIIYRKAIGLIDNPEINVFRLIHGEDKRHESFQVDAFDYLNHIKDQYDLIILDPPAFAKHNNVLANALQGYKRLNIKAIEQIKPGGIIFTFSCSQVVTRENFRKSVFAAAANTGRNVRILHQISQPPDHPVNIYHPESEYLKGLVIYVE